MEKKLLQKLVEFRKLVKPVKADAHNPHFKSKYATIKSVLDTIEEPMLECGIGFYQKMCILENRDFLTTIIYNIDNEKDIIENVIPVYISNQDMQKLGSAITYARRYGLVSLLGLEQDDDDGEMATHKPSYKKEALNNTEVSKKILKLTDKYPYPKDNIGEIWGEAIQSEKGRNQLESYKKYKLEKHNVKIEIDLEFEKVLADMELGF